MKLSKTFQTWLKVIVTIAGLIYAIRIAPLEEIGGQLQQLQWRWVIGTAVIVLIGFVVRAGRWWLLLRGAGANVGFGRLLNVYFIGAFFNTFLPSGFGGDVVRVVVATDDMPAPVAAGTVIIDRLSGLMMLFITALAAFLLAGEQFSAELRIQVGIISILGLAGGLLLLEGNLFLRVLSWLPKKLSKIPSQIIAAIQACGWPAVFQAFGASLIFNFLLFLRWQWAGFALGYDIPFAYYIGIVPVLSIALLIPSIGGLGIRESLAPLLFANAGLSPAEAISLSLLVFIVNRLIGLIGAPVYLFSNVRTNTTSLQQE